MKCHFCEREKQECYEYKLLKLIDCICNECFDKHIEPIKLFLNNTNNMLLIKTNYELELIDISNGKFNIKKIQELIDGYIEIYPYKSDEHLVLVNEDGINLRLEFNKLAQDIFNLYAYGNIIIIPKTYMKWEGYRWNIKKATKRKVGINNINIMKVIITIKENNSNKLQLLKSTI